MRNHKWYFKFSHWLMALAIFSAFFIILSIDEHGPLTPFKLKMINYHKWIGFSVLILFLPRLIASIKGYSKLPITTIEDKIAKFVHYGLYITMFTTPLLGWFMSSAKGFSISLFGIFPIPDLISKNLELGKFLKEVHEFSAGILLFLIFLHAGGALYRQFIKKEKILSRMFCSIKDNN